MRWACSFSFSQPSPLPPALYYVLDCRGLLVGGNLDALHGHLQIRFHFVHIKGSETVEEGRHGGALELGRGGGLGGEMAVYLEQVAWQGRDASARVLGLLAPSCGCVGEWCECLGRDLGRQSGKAAGGTLLKNNAGGRAGVITVVSLAG